MKVVTRRFHPRFWLTPRVSLRAPVLRPPSSMLVSFVMGAILGVLFLHPITMAMYWLEFHAALAQQSSFWAFAVDRMQRAFSGPMLLMTAIFSLLGGVTAMVGTLAYREQARWRRLLDSLTRELTRDLATLLQQGEDETHEFKASLRWDYRLRRANLKLEHAVLKTIAGFMNNQGGTLLIGVDDQGRVLGLENDYQTLKHPNRDDFEALLMALIARHIGTDFCPLVHVLFHTLRDHEICRVLVEPAPRPAFLREDDTPALYLRTGNTTRELNVEEAAAYIQRRWPV